MKTSFKKWFITFLEEKNIDMSEPVKCKDGTLQIGDVCSAILSASDKEQEGIKSMMVKIDFVNGSIEDYIRHLAMALSESDRVTTF